MKLSLTWAALGLLLSLGWNSTGRGQNLEGPVEPSVAETLLLEVINRGRADPQTDAQRCLEFERMTGGVDLDMFQREMQEHPPCQPLFFDMRLQRSALAHARYLSIHDTLTHDEDPMQEGYTGLAVADRSMNFGYPNNKVGENCGTGLTDPAEIHAGYVIDANDSGPATQGPGGMQLGRGHRVNTYNPQWCVAGLALDTQGTPKTSYSLGYLEQRFIGGVIYFDEDGDEFYSAGEGVGGAVLSTGNQTVPAFQSGAFTIPVSQTGGQVIMQVATLTLMRPYPAGEANYKVDFILTPEEAQVLRDLRAEQDRLVFAVRSRNQREATILMQQMARTYRDTPVAGWVSDADTALDMRKVYVDIAEMVEGGQQPGRSLLERRLRQLTTLQERYNTAEWAAVGQEIGEAFIALGQAGTVNQSLVSELGIDEEPPASDLTAFGEPAASASPFAGRTEAEPSDTPAPPAAPATGQGFFGQFGEPAGGASPFAGRTVAEPSDSPAAPATPAPGQGFGQFGEPAAGAVGSGQDDD